MAKRSYKQRRKTKLMRRVSRAFISIFILTGLVLGVTISVKELSTTDTNRFAKLVRKVLSKANIDVSEEQIGDVAGEFVSRISQTNLASGVSIKSLSEDGDTSEISDDSEKVSTTDDAVLNPSVSNLPEQVRVGIISEIQEDLASLEKTLFLLSEKGIGTIFILGDLTNYGDVETLQSVKSLLDSSGITYYAIPGDHDLAQSVGPDNFISVFGELPTEVEINEVTFLFLNNSANYTQISNDNYESFEDSLSDSDFLLLAQPLYTDDLNSPFRDMYMGHSREVPEEESLVEMQEKVLDQRNDLLKIIRESSIRAIFSGDHHKSSKQDDPEREDLIHYTIGAISDTVNELPQRLLQSPRFSILTINEDWTYTVNEVLLD